ncbi:MAG: glycosyltransferase [Bacteroidota bacterium]|nr:glycosyltransferase [Bacteroidota bacterium]
MVLVSYILFSFLIIYAGILIYFGVGFLKTHFFRLTNDATTPITIIICARNEEKTIGRCLVSILKQDYDFTKVQLLLINDASSDSTVFQAEAILKNSKINYKIISNPTQKGKKLSITYAISQAKNNLLVLRDADTFTTSTLWLQTISDFYNTTNSDLIIAPIAIANNFGILWALQAIETNVLTVVSCGSSYFKKAFLCNGANLVFTKTIFEKVNGYSSHIKINSGDDVLFLEDVKKIPEAKINYLKSEQAIVYTYPSLSFAKLIHQKIRWASKFKNNKNKLNLLLAILSFGVNLAWLFCLFYSLFVPQNGGFILFFVLFKLIIDNLLLFLASRFVKNRGLGWFSLPVGLIYPLYACVVAIASVFIKPKWKL